MAQLKIFFEITQIIEMFRYRSTQLSALFDHLNVPTGDSGG